MNNLNSVPVTDVKTEIYLDLKEQLLEGKLTLPGLPDIAQRVQRAINKEDAKVSDIAKVIQSDIPLSGRIIQIANSPLYKGVVPAENCQAAVTRLGLKVVKNLVTSFAVRRLYTSKTAATRRSMEALWKHSVKIGAISFTLARISPGFDPEKAMLGGLVHDIGELLILQYAESRQELLSNADLLAEFIDTFKHKLGAVILKHWRFDSEIVSVALDSENWTRNTKPKAEYADVVMVAHMQECLVTGKMPDKVQSFEELPVYNKFPIFKLGEQAYKELMLESQDEIAELQKLLM